MVLEFSDKADFYKNKLSKFQHQNSLHLDIFSESVDENIGDFWVRAFLCNFLKKMCAYFLKINIFLQGGKIKCSARHL